MQRLIDDMLTLSRLESADYPMRPELVDMRALVEDVAEEARALSGGKHEVTVDVNGPDLMGSPEELRSAFANLASNAVRYTPPGGTVNISWSATERGLRYAVSDTGIGIDPVHISRLTERFYRVDTSRSRSLGGTGLGLSIVKHIVERHRGRLSIDSALGKGTTVHVLLPVAVS